MDANTRIPDSNRNIRKDHKTTVAKSLAVVTAYWIRDYIICICFNDGTEQEIDFDHYLTTHDHPLIRPFRDLKRFQSFYVDHGNLVWGENWEMIFPTWKLHRGYLDE